MKKLVIIGAVILFTSGYKAQKKENSDSHQEWSVSNESNIKLKGKRQITPQKYLTFALNGTQLKDKLFSAPSEKKVLINQSPCIITLPLPNGVIQQFYVVESSIMEPQLAAQFPDMKT